MAVGLGSRVTLPKQSGWEKATVCVVDGMYVQVDYDSSKFGPQWVLAESLEESKDEEMRPEDNTEIARGTLLLLPKNSGYTWATVLTCNPDYTYVQYSGSSGFSSDWCVTGAISKCRRSRGVLPTKIAAGEHVHVPRNSGSSWAEVLSKKDGYLQVFYPDGQKDWILQDAVAASSRKASGQPKPKIQMGCLVSLCKNSSRQTAVVTQIDRKNMGMVEVAYEDPSLKPEWVLMAGLENVFSSTPKSRTLPARGTYVKIPKYSGWLWATLLEVGIDYSLVSYETGSGVKPEYIVTASLESCHMKASAPEFRIAVGDMVHVCLNSDFMWGRVKKVEDGLVNVHYTDKKRGWVTRESIMAVTVRKMAEKHIKEMNKQALNNSVTNSGANIQRGKPSRRKRMQPKSAGGGLSKIFGNIFRKLSNTLVRSG